MAVGLQENAVAQPPAQRPRPLRKRFLWALGMTAVMGAAGLADAVPRLRDYWGTAVKEETIVSGHVTAVSARVSDIVERVYVNVNDYVEAGDLLLTLDKQPYESAVARKRETLDLARAGFHRMRQRGSPKDEADPRALQVAAATVVEAEREFQAAVQRLSYTEIRAPVAGFVKARRVHAGSTVRPGQELFAIRPLSDIWVKRGSTAGHHGARSAGSALSRTAAAFSNGSGRFSRRNGAGAVRVGNAVANAAAEDNSAVGSSSGTRSNDGRDRKGNGGICVKFGAGARDRGPA
jgi:multidrug efflux pump subunit AcrA (membrane-fusion protein)